ncbi:MAG: hypothetical protein M0002_02760 [Rhodospirillales bacterium]|nr:hypothetical protein [Rhodospirillales bacterium]
MNVPALAETALPIYEVRLLRAPGSTPEISIWQMPARATPHIREPLRLGGLAGRNLELVEHRVLRRLAATGLRADYAPAATRTARGHALDEQTALRLALLFRALAPMRDRTRMRAVAEGIEAMGREEAAYWLGMTLHRPNPRRVLTALRYLLTDPAPPHQAPGPFPGPAPAQ